MPYCKPFLTEATKVNVNEKKFKVRKKQFPFSCIFELDKIIPHINNV